MCHPGGAEISLQPEWIHTTCSDRVTTKESVRKDKNRAIVCGHYLQNHSIFKGCLVVASPVHLLSFSHAPKQYCEADSRYILLPNWTDWYPWSLTWFGVKLWWLSVPLMVLFLAVYVKSLILYMRLRVRVMFSLCSPFLPQKLMFLHRAQFVWWTSWHILNGSSSSQTQSQQLLLKEV